MGGIRIGHPLPLWAEVAILGTGAFFLIRALVRVGRRARSLRHFGHLLLYENPGLYPYIWYCNSRGITYDADGRRTERD